MSLQHPEMISSANERIHPAEASWDPNVQGVSKKTLFKRLAPKKVVSRAAS